MIKHLSLDEVLALHSRLLEHFGGAEGVVDLGLLDSALHRPRSGYYQDAAEMAAALFESLIMNHSFVDGNKRVAFFATDVFLRLNGWKISVEPKEAHSFLIGLLEKGRCDMKHLLPWIRKSMVKVSDPR
jgi:death-on-curing protein